MTKKMVRGTLSTRLIADKKVKERIPLAKESDVLKKVLHLHGLGKLRILPHASQRMGERNVLYPEVQQALNTARHRPQKDRFSFLHNSWEYCMEGHTVDGRNLRIGVSLEKDPKSGERVLVITVIDLSI